MKKNIKNFDKFVCVILILLTVVSLIINAMEFTNMIYSDSYDNLRLNNLLITDSFNILLWVDNILIYIFALLYIIEAIHSKREILIKISFSVFSVMTTMIVTTFVINFIASLFGLF